MPAAAIGAAGSVAGAAVSGKAAKKVAKIQAQTAANQLAQTKQFYNDAVTHYQPDITAGNGAESIYNGLLGNGGDATASADAFNTWKNSTDYTNVLNTSNNAINANAYAGGMGRSGAALKALQTNAGNVANSYLQTYMGNLQNSINGGLTAKNSLSGQATTALSTNAAATQNAANASSNAALASGNASANALTNLGNLAANAYQSSYSNPVTGTGTGNSMGYNDGTLG